MQEYTVKQVAGILGYTDKYILYIMKKHNIKYIPSTYLLNQESVNKIHGVIDKPKAHILYCDEIQYKLVREYCIQNKIHLTKG